MEPHVLILVRDHILVLVLQDGLVPIAKLELPMSVLIIFVSMVVLVRYVFKKTVKIFSKI